MSRREIARKYLKERFGDSYFELWKCYKTSDSSGEPTAFVIINTYLNVFGGVSSIAVGSTKEELERIVLSEPDDFPIKDYLNEIEVVPYNGYYLGIYGKKIKL